jgi:hypothetical protein
MIGILIDLWLIFSGLFSLAGFALFFLVCLIAWIANSATKEHKNDEG